MKIHSPNFRTINMPCTATEEREVFCAIRTWWMGLRISRYIWNSSHDESVWQVHLPMIVQWNWDKYCNSEGAPFPINTSLIRWDRWYIHNELHYALSTRGEKLGTMITYTLIGNLMFSQTRRVHRPKVNWKIKSESPNVYCLNTWKLSNIHESCASPTSSE